MSVLEAEKLAAIERALSRFVKPEDEPTCYPGIWAIRWGKGFADATDGRILVHVDDPAIEAKEGKTFPVAYITKIIEDARSMPLAWRGPVAALREELDKVAPFASVKCEKCKGTGRSTKECPDCEGTGNPHLECGTCCCECTGCKGTGSIVSKSVCTSCSGSGEAKTRHPKWVQAWRDVSWPPQLAAGPNDDYTPSEKREGVIRVQARYLEALLNALDNLGVKEATCRISLEDTRYILEWKNGIAVVMGGEAR